jgi:hypothetical protein
LFAEEVPRLEALLVLSAMIVGFGLLLGGARGARAVQWTDPLSFVQTD